MGSGYGPWMMDQDVGPGVSSRTVGYNRLMMVAVARDRPMRRMSGQRTVGARPAPDVRLS